MNSEASGSCDPERESTFRGEGDVPCDTPSPCYCWSTGWKSVYRAVGNIVYRFVNRIHIYGMHFSHEYYAWHNYNWYFPLDRILWPRLLLRQSTHIQSYRHSSVRLWDDPFVHF